MAVIWLLLTVIGLIAAKVCCQSAVDFASPPPLPEEGMLIKYIIVHTHPGVVEPVQFWLDHFSGKGGGTIFNTEMPTVYSTIMSTI